MISTIDTQKMWYAQVAKVKYNLRTEKTLLSINQLRALCLYMNSGLMFISGCALYVKR